MKSSCCRSEKDVSIRRAIIEKMIHNQASHFARAIQGRSFDIIIENANHIVRILRTTVVCRSLHPQPRYFAFRHLVSKRRQRASFCRHRIHSPDYHRSSFQEGRSCTLSLLPFRDSISTIHYFLLMIPLVVPLFCAGSFALACIHQVQNVLHTKALGGPPGEANVDGRHQIE